MSRSPVRYMVQLTQSSGVEMNAHLVLEDKPTRQEQKLKTLCKYVEQYPSGWKKRLELAELLCIMGNWQQSVEEYSQVLQHQPHLMEVRLQLGKIFQMMGKKAEAIALYQSSLPLSCNVATRHHLAGLIEVCSDRPHHAVKLFQLAASTEPDNPAHWYALGQMHLETESPTAALQAFNAILSLNPDDFVALSQSYEPLFAVGNFQEAKQRLEQAFKLAPNDYRTLEKLAADRTRQGLVSGEAGKQTKQLIREALQLAPNSANAHQVLSQYHLRRGEWEKGVAVLLKFTEEHPNSFSGWYQYAWCLFHTGNSQAASEAILKTYGLYQNDCEIYRAMCEILPAAGRLEELHHSQLEEMLDRFPERWSVWVTAGRVLVENYQDIERGYTVSAKAVQLQPTLADAWFLHGRVLALAGKHQEAVEVMEQGWLYLPKAGGYLQSVSVAVWLGESYQALGDQRRSRKEMLEACERAKKLLAFNPTIADYWQGRALLALGDRTGAKQAYRSALKQQLLYPAHGEVKQVLKGL